MGVKTLNKPNKPKNDVVEPFEVPEDEVQRIAYFDTRYYKVPLGKEIKLYDSVTTILNIVSKPFLEKWRGDIGNDAADKVMTEALGKGSSIHHAVEVLIDGGLVLYNDEFSPITYDELFELEKDNKVYVMHNQNHYLEVFKIFTWLKTINAKDILSERMVFSHEYEYAGTLDAILTIPKTAEYFIAGSKPIKLKKGRYIVDWKTGKSFSGSYYHQLAAYYYALTQDGHNSHLEGAFVVHSNAKTRSGIKGLQTHFLTVDDLEKYFEEFVAIRKVHRIHNTPPTLTEVDFPQRLIL